MSARIRALVQRPGRKIHWATLGPGETAWIGVGCSIDVPVFGITEHGRDWPAFLNVAEDDAAAVAAGAVGRVCAHCRTALQVASLALAEVDDVRASNLDREALAAQVHTLEGEVRSLRAEIAAWTTAAIGELRASAARRFRPVTR